MTTALVGRRLAAARVTTQKAVLGAGLILALLAGAGTIYAAFSGRFTSYVTISADLPAGQSVDPGNNVDYRGVAVGTVADQGQPLPGGAVRVKLHIKPGRMNAIPTNATASVAPSSLFGTEAVMLAAPTPSTVPVRSGQLLAASTAGSQSLQGTLTSLTTLLNGLHPAELDETLNAMATALGGQGQAISAASVTLDHYLTGLIPQLPTLEQDITLLSPLLNGLSASVPALLNLFGNVSTTATTITTDKALLGQLLSTGGTVSNTASAFLTAVQGSLHATVVNLLPMLDDVAAVPHAFGNLLSGLDGLAKAWGPEFAYGPAVKITGEIFVPNPTALIIDGTGFADELGTTNAVAKEGFGNLDPPTYTAADCPRYGNDPGPNCGNAPAAQAASPSAAPSNQTASPAATPAATTTPPADPASLAKVASALGIHSSTTSNLFLTPLLQSLMSP